MSRTPLDMDGSNIALNDLYMIYDYTSDITLEMSTCNLEHFTFNPGTKVLLTLDSGLRENIYCKQYTSLPIFCFIYVYNNMYIIHTRTPGFNFSRGPGAYAPRICCGPLGFSD